MTNEGNKLSKEILEKYKFERKVLHDRDNDEIKMWYKNGITIYENSWWITELDKDGEMLETPKSFYSNEETPPEITFAFATYVKSDNSFKGGFSIKTDQQLKNLYYSLSNIELTEEEIN